MPSDDLVILCPFGAGVNLQTPRMVLYRTNSGTYLSWERRPASRPRGLAWHLQERSQIPAVLCFLSRAFGEETNPIRTLTPNCSRPVARLAKRTQIPTPASNKPCPPARLTKRTQIPLQGWEERRRPTNGVGARTCKPTPVHPAHLGDW